MENRFKIGDKVIGNKKANRYSITTEGFIATVINVFYFDDSFNYGIEISQDGGTIHFGVDADCFDLYIPQLKIREIDWRSKDGKV